MRHGSQGQVREQLQRFLGRGKESPLQAVTKLPVLIDGKLAVSFYLTEGLRRRAMSRMIDGSEVDWAALTKNALFSLWARMDGASMTNKQMIFISRVINEVSSARKPFSFFDRFTTSIGCCCLFAQDRNIGDMRDISLSSPTKGIQEHRPLGSFEYRQVSRFAGAASRLAASEDC